VGNEIIDLREIERIWIIGLGKASAQMARAAERILGSRIKGGCVVSTEATALQNVESIVGGHPLPTEDSLDAAKRLLTIARIAGEKDLVLAMISGGGSALAEWPIEGVTLEDLQAVNSKLILSGLSIHEINAVRQVLSRFKGGGLAQAVAPARLVSLIISDVVGDDLSLIASGPTVATTKNYSKALRILKDVDADAQLIDRIYEISRSQVGQPQQMSTDHVTNLLIGNNDTALFAMKQMADVLNLSYSIVAKAVTGEAREVAAHFVQHCAEAAHGHPQAFLMGGETTVTVRGTGKGGRNHEFALGALVGLSAGMEGFALASVGTDGRDYGDAAGAIIDTTSPLRARQADLDAVATLANNDSMPFFGRLGDQIMTGPTGTNVCDIMVSVYAN